MALLYRIIPDQWGFFFERGAINLKDGLTTEDLLYDLGYINKSQHWPYLSITTDPMLGYHTWQQKTGPGMYFFTSPWDAVKTFRYIDCHSTFFSNRGVRICEYDIPDEIIAESWSGEGQYSGELIPEIKIPLELILKDPETNMTPELNAALREVALIQTQESFAMQVPILRSFVPNITDAQIKNLEKFSKEKQDKINDRRFENVGIFKKSPYVTGRRFYLTIIDFREIMQYDGYHYDELIPKSNGILTEENLAEYLKRNSVR